MVWGSGGGQLTREPHLDAVHPPGAVLSGLAHGVIFYFIRNDWNLGFGFWVLGFGQLSPGRSAPPRVCRALTGIAPPISISMSVSTSISTSIYLSVYLSIYLSIYICLSVYPSIYVCMNLSIYIHICQT